jgi:endo-1,4-beta-xylanase
MDRRDFLRAGLAGAGMSLFGDSRPAAAVNLSGIENPGPGNTWYVGPAILEPGPPGTPDEVAVKDPSIVFYNGEWRLFYSGVDRAGRYSINYVSSERLSGLASAIRHRLPVINGEKGYAAAAPQVFFFEPQGKWYLIFQTILEKPGASWPEKIELPGFAPSKYTPMYSTTCDITDPESWSEPRVLIDKKDPAKWIDFWVICDEERAFLFFTRDHLHMYWLSTPITKFPLGFDRLAKARGAGKVHEASCIYKVGGQEKYLMLFEQRRSRDVRFFGYAEADDLSGPWRRARRPFASSESLVFSDGVEPWTSMVSHGELLRSGYDQQMEIWSAEDIEFLIQGTTSIPANYHETRWGLGLIRNFKDPKRGAVWKNENGGFFSWGF